MPHKETVAALRAAVEQLLVGLLFFGAMVSCDQLINWVFTINNHTYISGGGVWIARMR